MSDVRPAALACEALREYLLRYLPSRVATLNAARAAVLKSSLVGPFTISSGSLLLGATRPASTSVTLPTGAAVTASAIATAINAAVSGITASADTDGRLVLTADDAPTEGTASAVAVGASSANTIFGWDDGGVFEVRSALTAPNYKGVMDGFPASLPDYGRSFCVIIEDRESVPLGGYRRDMHTVTMGLSVWAVDRNVQVHRSREYVQAAVQAVLEVLTSDDGRTLGRATQGDIEHLEVTRVRVRGMPFQAFDEAKRPLGPPADVAAMTVSVKVFARPDAAP